MILLNIISSNDIRLKKEIILIRDLLNLIIANIPYKLSNNIPYNIQSQLIKHDIEKNENKFLEPYISLDHTLKFEDIIGCEKAKLALEDNVIIHLNTPQEYDQSAVFQGINKCIFSYISIVKLYILIINEGLRKGTGNVLLHGPPGK